MAPNEFAITRDSSDQKCSCKSDDSSRDMHFIPPCAEHLFELIETGRMATPLDSQIHTGEEDWQSHPVAVSKLGTALKIPVSIVPGAWHKLPTSYVSALLDTWSA